MTSWERIYEERKLTLETRNLRTEFVQQTLHILLLHGREPTRVSPSQDVACHLRRNGSRMIIQACPQDVLSGVSKMRVKVELAAPPNSQHSKSGSAWLESKIEPETRIRRRL